jgi:cobalt-zinc-cadmium efflux system outer membrane protein
MEPAPSRVLRLSLDEAMAMFLRQNLDLIMANYGIDAARGRQITARLFPNPRFAVNTLSSYTQGCDIQRCGAVAPTLSQMFEVAGRRGFRIAGAELDTLSTEARFEDTVRQLSYTLKDSYYRVQRQRMHLAVDQEIRNTLEKLGLAGGVIEKLQKLFPGKPGTVPKNGMDTVQIRLGLLFMDADAQVIQDLQTIEDAAGDLRILLGIDPDVELELTSELDYRETSPNLAHLLEYALENRPDIRAKRLIRDKRKTELQLARAIRYPNVTVDVGYMMQGPRGPDNQQQGAFNLSAPLPVFNRNQGGIVEADVAVRVAETDVEKTRILIQNEVAVAYRNFQFSRRLVFATKGSQERALELFRQVQQAFSKGEVGILDLENTQRSVGDSKETYIEALFGYQRNWLRLEQATGQSLTN